MGQDESVEYIAATLSGLLKQEDGKRRLFLISTYVIGKERVLLEVNIICLLGHAASILLCN